jgi:charged multivesicular body protein 3
MKQQETKAKNLILEADKRAAHSPQQQAQAQARRDVRTFAEELVRCRRAVARLITSKAQLNSVQMQVNEAFAVRKIEGSMRTSVGVMRDVHSLIRLPELAETARELSRELIKAGIIEEIVGESLPDDGLAELEDEPVEGDVDKVLDEVLKSRLATPGKLALSVIAPEPVAATALHRDEEEEEDEESGAVIDQLRNRLEALKS